ncbi:MAG TPA: helix-turn-helix domain-containing protein [Candidatus Moranbacteria bacterium]|nr:helix-turn-helix domain-containing protein [Candidatus Moranbacteria bacterium]HRZ33981.1 helix-turn-helix domain-containing protein [Candidatus Moranbacteria bacterium]
MVRFTTKKIDSLTLGERMKKIRNERRLSLAEISKSTKIQSKYLEYLEEGEYMKLPADVYVKGFIKSYATFMGLDDIGLIKQYQREKGIHKNIKKISDDDKNNIPIKFSSFIITPKIIIISAIILVAVAILAYLYKEVNSFISTPRLVVIKPSDGSSVEGNSIHVTGIAEKDALVFINDQPVMVNENGEFGEDVGLKPNLNIITVKVRNKFDKENSQTFSVNANFHDSSQQGSDKIPEQNMSEQLEKSDEFYAEIYVNPSPTWLYIEVDGDLKYSGVLLPQSIKSFNVKNKISVTSGKGNQTFIKINGNDMGILSDIPGVVRSIEYNFKGKIN